MVVSNSILKLFHISCYFYKKLLPQKVIDECFDRKLFNKMES